MTAGFLVQMTFNDITMNKDKKTLERKLQDRFFCVGGGAWQQLWETDKKKPSMGFLTDPVETEPVTPSTRDLKSSIRPELLKRFRAEVLVMQPMTKEDYKLLIPKFGQSLPEMLQGRFIQLAEANLDMAVKEQLGMRYFEEILTDTVCIVSQSQDRPNPKAHSSHP
jgi:hypothetical protein